MWGSMVVYFAWALFYHGLFQYPGKDNCYWVMEHTITTGRFWFCVILTPAIALAPRSVSWSCCRTVSIIVASPEIILGSEGGSVGVIRTIAANQIYTTYFILYVRIIANVWPLPLVLGWLSSLSSPNSVTIDRSVCYVVSSTVVTCA